MENHLAEINSLLGVIGSFVCDADGKLLLQALPDTYDADKLSITARVIAQTIQALETSGQRITDMDLQFDGGRIILKNLRGGTLAVLCARNINLPLLNMTAGVAAKKIAAQLKPKSTAAPREPAAVPPPAPVAPAPAPVSPSLFVPPPAPVSTPVMAPQEELLAPPLFQELYQEACRAIEEARHYRVDLRVLDELAFWLATARTRWLLAPVEKREILFGGRLSQVDSITTLFQKLGYEENRRFNTTFGKQRLHFLMPARDLSVDVFLDNFVMYHRLELASYLAEGEMVLAETPLLLTRLQSVEIGDSGLRDLCALLIEHDLSLGPAKGKIDASAITHLCSEDWGWYKTVSMNLDRLKSFVAGTLSPADRVTVQERVQRLQQSMGAMPKSLRWQTRARLGESVRWYETPMVGHPVGRPDMALG